MWALMDTSTYRIVGSPERGYFRNTQNVSKYFAWTSHKMSKPGMKAATLEVTIPRGIISFLLGEAIISFVIV